MFKNRKKLKGYIKFLNLKNLFKGCFCFVFGLTISAFLGFKFYFVALIIFFVLFLFGLLFKKRFSSKNYWFVFLAAFLGSFWFSFNVRFCYDFANGFDKEEEFAVLSLVEKEFFENGCQYVFRVKQIGEKKPPLAFNVKMYFKNSEEIDCNYFDFVKARLKFNSTLKNRNIFSFNSDVSRKIFLKAKFKTPPVILENDSFFANFLNLKDNLLGSVEKFVDAPYSFLITGLVFGKMHKLPYNIKRIVNRCGISHIFAVSGLHVGVLTAFLILILRFFRAPKGFSFVVLFFCLFVYAFVVGFTPSVLRAILMSLSLFLGKIFKKEVKPVFSVFFAAALILLIWPTSVLGFSFLLSFSCVLGIIFLKDLLFKFFITKFEITNSFFAFFVEGICTSIAAFFSTAFIVMFSFGKISVVSPISNLIVVPVLPFVYLLSFFVVVFSGFFAQGATFFATFCVAAFKIIFYALGFIAKFPFCYLPTNFFVVKLIAFLLVIFIFLNILFKNSLNFNRDFFFHCFLIIFFPIFFVFFSNRNSVKIFVLTTKIGKSTIFCSRNRVVVLNYGGNNNHFKNLVEFLESKGVRKVDLLAFSSEKGVKLSGFLDFLEAMPPKFLVICKNHPRIREFEFLKFKRTKVVLKEKFILKLFPFIFEFLNTKEHFGFYLNFNESYLAYSKGTEFLEYLLKNKYLDVAVLEEKIYNFKKNENLKKCLFISNQLKNAENFGFLEDVKYLEFIFKNDRIKKGEF